MNHYQQITQRPTQINEKKIKTEEKLSDAIGYADEVLARAKTVFPFTMFPDTISIDRTKVTITKRSFLAAGEVVSISIEDVLNVTAGVGPLLGTIQISTRYFDPKMPYVIEHLWRGDALKIKRILQGYIIARQKEIDCSALSTRELARDLDMLGKVAPPDKV